MQQDQISRIDRYRGSMVGVLCGDALGAPYETWEEERIHADITARGGLHLFDYQDPWGKEAEPFPAGRPTDDSELTAALAEHLAANEEPIEGLYKRFRSCVVDGNSLLCSRKAYGFGGTTRRALTQPSYRLALERPDTKEPIASNGALMRAAPIALRYRRSPVHMTLKAQETSRVTHLHPQAVDAAVVYVHILSRLIEGETYASAVAYANNVMPLLTSDLELAALYREPAKRPVLTQKFGGSALYTLQVVHWAVSTSDSFEEGIEKAITIGSDTDTYGAVAGGLLGALYGIQSIPRRWHDKLIGATRMKDLATDLYRKAQAVDVD